MIEKLKEKLKEKQALAIIIWLLVPPGGEFPSLFKSVCPLIGIGEAQSSSETSTCWSKGVSTGAKSLCSAEPNRRPRTS